MPLYAVTGALGYSGKAIAERLLARGDPVRTLTSSPGRPNPFGDRLEVRRLAFDDPPALAAALRGVDVLVNTYWVRFNHARFTFAGAVANTRGSSPRPRRRGCGGSCTRASSSPRRGAGWRTTRGNWSWRGRCGKRG